MLSFNFTLLMRYQVSLLGCFINFKVHVLDSSSFIGIGVYLRSQGKIPARNVPESVSSIRRDVRKVMQVSS